MIVFDFICIEIFPRFLQDCMENMMIWSWPVNESKIWKSNFAEHIIFKGKYDFFLWPTGSWSTETNESQVLITTS